MLLFIRFFLFFFVVNIFWIRKRRLAVLLHVLILLLSMFNIFISFSVISNPTRFQHGHVIFLYRASSWSKKRLAGSDSTLAAICASGHLEGWCTHWAHKRSPWRPMPHLDAGLPQVLLFLMPIFKTHSFSPLVDHSNANVESLVCGLNFPSGHQY